mgnify:CR=1 FL=1
MNGNWRTAPSNGRESLHPGAGIRRTGSAALDICYVASGKADLYFELILRPWDYAAAIVIVEEAGGVICTTENQPMPIDQIVGVRCGNDENLAEFDALVQNL